MSELPGGVSNRLPRPISGSRPEWQAYWQALGQSWRTEPEIADERRAYLAARRDVPPDITRGTYPFSGVRLSRADIEWLLATHEDGRGLVDWSDLDQRQRLGLDLRGADLRGTPTQTSDLHGLPLARLRAGLTIDEWQEATQEQRAKAAVLLSSADLRWAELQGAILCGADLSSASLDHARLEEGVLYAADLTSAHLEDADLTGANLVWAQLAHGYLPGVTLTRANLRSAHLEGADLRAAHFEQAHLAWAHLNGADLDGVVLRQARCCDPDDPQGLPAWSGAHLEGAKLDAIYAEGADLRWARLRGASIILAHLEGASLDSAHLEGANLSGTFLEGATLAGAFMMGANFSDAHVERAEPSEAHLEGADCSGSLLGAACLCGVHLAGANLAHAHLERADLRGAHLEGREFPAEELERVRRWRPDFPASLPPTNLEGAVMDETTALPPQPRPSPLHPHVVHSAE